MFDTISSGPTENRSPGDMLPRPLFLTCAKICEALVFKGQQPHLLQIWEIDAPTTSKIPVKSVGKQVPQRLLGIIFRGKFQRRINSIVLERKIQNLKYRVA